MGCNNSKPAARTVESSNSQVSENKSERERLMEEGASSKEPEVVQPSQPLIAKSRNKDTQKIIDKIQFGEDFERNKWRCLHSPDFAYYSLSPFARLQVEIVEARKLIPSITSGFESYVGDEPDGFVKVFVDDCFKYSTRCISNDRNPKWQDQKRMVDIVADRSMVRLHVYDSDSNDNTTLIDPIGFVEFCIGDIPFDTEIDGWLELRFPGNLQGYGSDRYAEHMMAREEENATPMPTEPVNKKEPEEKSPKKKDGRKSNEKGNENEDNVDLYKVEAQVIRESVANRMFKRFRGATKRDLGDDGPPPGTQFNAGEIHVKLKLVRIVNENTALFAKALVPSAMSFASFIQEEFLPKLDVQELLDDVLDLKIEIVDEMLFAVYAFACYVLAWRSIIVSGLLFIAVVSGVKSSMLFASLCHLWMAMILVLLKFDDWRLPMTTNGQNAPLNEEGFRFVARCRDVNEMQAYLMRMIASRSGNITSMQDLMHFSGTIVQGDGQLSVTFDELLKALRDLWFLEFPSGQTHLEVHSLVRVHDRRRGTVTKIDENKNVAENHPLRHQIHVQFDEFDEKAADLKEEFGVYESWDVSIRPSVPAIPRMFVPRTVLSLVASLQLEVDAYKRTILPYALTVREFFRWQKPSWMLLVLGLLLFRAYVSFEGFLEPESWCHFALAVMAGIRNAILGGLVVFVLVGQAAIWKVGRGIVMLAANKLLERREAPKCWAFYKDHFEPYKTKKKKTE